MAIVRCTERRKKMSSLAAACPACGAPPPAKHPDTGKHQHISGWWIAVGLFVALFGTMLAIGSSPESAAKSQDRAAIAQCWREQRRPSLDPAAARLAAGACELAERRFIEAYQVSP